MGFPPPFLEVKMVVRDILSEIARIAEGDELFIAVKNSQESTDQQIQNKVDVLLACYNAIVSEIALNNYEYLVKQTVSLNRFNLSTLEKPLLKIVGVTDTKGNQISYTRQNDEIFVNKAPFTLIYRAIPLKQEIDDKYIFDKTQISDSVVVYGALAEYYLRESRFEEALSFESKFRQALNCRLDNRSRKMKAGKRWGL